MQTYEYELPVSKKKVVFREVTWSDREEAISLTRKLGKDRTQMQVGDLIASYALLTVDGKEPADPDPTIRFNSWPYKDTVCYITFFSQLCLVTDEDLEETSKQAKKLQMQYMSGNAGDDHKPEKKPQTTSHLSPMEDLR